MRGDTSGLRWPLALFFLITLCGGAIGLVQPSWIGNGRLVPSLLVLAALLAGGALYFPHYLAGDQSAGHRHHQRAC